MLVLFFDKEHGKETSSYGISIYREQSQPSQRAVKINGAYAPPLTAPPAFANLEAAAAAYGGKTL